MRRRQSCVRPMSRPVPGICRLSADAASYQTGVPEHCMKNNIFFYIPAPLKKGVRDAVLRIEENRWEPRPEEPLDAQCEISWKMEKIDEPFRLIIYRRRIDEQLSFSSDEEAGKDVEAARGKGFVYRTAAANDQHRSASEILKFYALRGECSENRIKELKSDFAGDKMPAGDFEAKALYFQLCALAYNLFILEKLAMPAELQTSRAKKIRLRVYSAAALPSSVAH